MKTLVQCAIEFIKFPITLLLEHVLFCFFFSHHLHSTVLKYIKAIRWTYCNHGRKSCKWWTIKIQEVQRKEKKGCFCLIVVPCCCPIKTGFVLPVSTWSANWLLLEDGFWKSIHHVVITTKLPYKIKHFLTLHITE